MIEDRFGGRHSQAGGAAVAEFETAVWNVLAHRPQATAALEAALAVTSDLIAAHALRGFCGVSLARRETLAAARVAAHEARAFLTGRTATANETALVEALELAVAGRLGDAAARLHAHLEDAPHDLLAFKLEHGLRFMIGDVKGMLASALRTSGSLSPQYDGYGFVLGCQAFALEESCRYREAEAVGRAAVEMEPFDAWGAHAVGHVYEMRKTPAEGVRWLEQTRATWSGCNNFAFHMAWHLALCHIEERRFDVALDLYDLHIRPLPTDDFRDFANAASMLRRMEQHEMKVGARWEELATLARRRADDTTLVFASLHYLLALIATGDNAAAAVLLAALTARAQVADDQGRAAHAVGVALALALTGRPRSRKEATAAVLARELALIGGSKAQRDVFVRALVDVAMKAGDAGQARTILATRETPRDLFERDVFGRFVSPEPRRVA